jgi:hypothetical protein
LKNLSKQERFYFHVGLEMSMCHMRCFINKETLEVKIHSAGDEFLFDEEDDENENKL